MTEVLFIHVHVSYNISTFCLISLSLSNVTDNLLQSDHTCNKKKNTCKLLFYLLDGGTSISVCTCMTVLVVG